MGSAHSDGGLIAALRQIQEGCQLNAPAGKWLDRESASKIAGEALTAHENNPTLNLHQCNCL